MSKFDKDELGTRMKEFYENVPKTRLTRKVPVAIRLDGSHFHTFTRGFQKPFDQVLIKSMQDTMKYLCENIQGCVLGYTQSDEITLILTDYKKQTSSAWFDYEVQKVVSTSAALATMAFNRAFRENAEKWIENYYEAWNHTKEEDRLVDVYEKAMEMGATFDSRCFNIPKEEVCNLLYWRQHDASKNSISMAAYANFSHNTLQGKSSTEKQDMLMLEKGINWNDYPTTCKRGCCCVKSEKGWVIDNEIPIFLNENRSYVEDRVNFVGVGADTEKKETVDKMKLIRERLSILEKNSYESLFNIKRTGKDTFTVTWQPQYGEPFDMYASVSDEGVLFYGADKEVTEENTLSLFKNLQDAMDGWNQEMTDLFIYGKQKEFSEKEEEEENIER